MKYCLFISLLLSIQPAIRAQEKNPTFPSAPIPVELLAGNNRLNFQMTVTKKIVPGKRFGVFSLLSFAADYQYNKSNNEFMVPVQFNYELFKNLSVNAGGAMNSNWGFRPSAGFQYAYANKTFVVVIAPSVYLTDSHNIETFALVIYKPAIINTLGFYSRLQALYSLNTESGKHDRSYGYARIGVSSKKITFGLGANLDWYSPYKIYRENYGAFASINLF